MSQRSTPLTPRALCMLQAFDRTQSKLHQAALKGRGAVQGRAMTGVKAQTTAHEEVDATDATVDPLWLQVNLTLPFTLTPFTLALALTLTRILILTSSRSTSSAKRLPVPSSVRPCPTPGQLAPRSVRRKPRPGTTPNGARVRPSRWSSSSVSSK